MYAPRLRFAISADPNVIAYRVYRWRGEKPVHLNPIKEIISSPVLMTVRVPLRRTGQLTYQMPVTSTGVVTVLLDGQAIGASVSGREVLAAQSVESWQLVEASYQISGMAFIDNTISERDLQVELYDIAAVPVAQTPGQVSVRCQPRVTSDITYLYGVTAVNDQQIESELSPIGRVQFSPNHDLQVQFEVTDGTAWTIIGSSGLQSMFGQIELTCPGTTAKPSALAGVAATTQVVGATATVNLSWVAPTPVRQIQTSVRLTPLIGGLPAGQAQLTAPFILSLPPSEIRVGIAAGLVTPPVSSCQLLAANATSHALEALNPNTTYTAALYVRDAGGFYSSPVVMRIVVGAITSGGSTTVTIL